MKDYLRCKLDNKGAFSINSIISIAITLIIAAFVLLPGFRNFAQLLIDDLTTYWNDTVSTSIFPEG
jgi:hypothetical protein